MKKLKVGVIFLTLSFTSLAQYKAELGFFGGIAYYLGDINPNRQFYSNAIAMGGIYRYNFNPRYSLRGSMLFSNISAFDRDFHNPHQQARIASFDTEVVDLALQLEFNFQSFWSPKKSKTKSFVPYLAGGIGFIAPSSASSSSSITIPMGIGIKLNTLKKWTGTLEWSFRKSFSDNLDSLDDFDQYNTKNIAHNNDWVSFVGFTISYKLFSDNEECYSYGKKKEQEY